MWPFKKNKKITASEALNSVQWPRQSTGYLKMNLYCDGSAMDTALKELIFLASKTDVIDCHPENIKPQNKFDEWEKKRVDDFVDKLEAQF